MWQNIQPNINALQLILTQPRPQIHLHTNGINNLLLTKILDIKMPYMDGFQLYQEMKKIDSNVKVCFLTASELYHEELRKQQGHYEFAAVAKHLLLRKPIINEDL